MGGTFMTGNRQNHFYYPGRKMEPLAAIDLIKLRQSKDSIEQG